MPLALLALAISAFCIGSTEFVILGLLPEVAESFSVDIPAAGFLVTGYALGVVVGAPLLTILGTRIRNKDMLVGLMGLFVAGNLLSALAPTYGLMLTGRILASFAHGAFFGIGSVVAARLVPEEKKASAIAMMFTGLTVATIMGVPLGTFVGQAWGWRSTFAIITGLGLVALAGILFLVPREAQPSSVPLARELATFRNPQVWLAMGVTVLGFGGIFATFTYIAPMATELAGFGASMVPWIMVLFGVGCFAGNIVGGKLADKHLVPSLFGMIGGLAVLLFVFTAGVHSQPVVLVFAFLIGFTGFGTVPGLQKRTMDQAPDAPTLASAANIGAFNLGNALAAWLGGAVISAGLGYEAPNWVGGLLALGAVALLGVSVATRRRAPQLATA